jgi:hypothetical protein
MNQSPEPADAATDTDPETASSTSQHIDPLARLARFFRPSPATAGALPAPAGEDERTEEFNPLDGGGDPVGNAFPVAVWGGYERAAVDARFAELEQELTELRARLDPESGVEAEIQHLGDETAEILRVAHGKADAMVKKAQADADAVIAGAEARAAAMIADAEEHLRRLDHDTDVVWAERMRLTEDTRRLAERLIQLADSAVERFPPEADPPES